MSRQDHWTLGRPHKASIPNDMSAYPLTLSPSLAALAEEAATEVKAFDTEHGQTMAPYAAILLRSESAASSQIERLSASARKIAEAEVTGTGTEHALMIASNVRAMKAALNLADILDLRSVLAMHGALMEGHDPEIAGQLREDQVWIGGRAAWGAGSPQDADFVPPYRGTGTRGHAESA